MKIYRTLAAATLATGLMLSLTACGEDSDVGNENSSTSAGSTVEEAAAAPEGPMAILKDGEPVAPGSEFTYGDVLEIPALMNQPDFEEDHYEARINLSIKEVKVAPASDLQSLEDPQEYAGMTPVYVYKDLEIIEGSGPGFADEHFVVVLNLWAADADQPAQQLNVIDYSGQSPLCAGSESMDNSDGDTPNVPGKKVTDCDIFLIEEGQSVESITYGGHSYKDSAPDAEEPYEIDPIVFTA